MESRVQKWGNSLGLRIPKSFAEEVEVEDGSPIDISVVNGELVVRPLRPREYDLESLVEAIDPTNVHEAIETGPPVGREVW
ncbi:MAG: AbrB/MazE/SpoVT family DNA-binding domain-containing protein [Actinomycetota bacterium]